jgi:hypothetical protein
MRVSGDGSIGTPLGVENGLLEPSPETHPPEGLYIARTLARDRREVLLWVRNATLRNQQKLTKGSHLTHSEPVTLVALPDVEQPEVQDIAPKLQTVIPSSRPNLSGAEPLEL